MRTADHPALNRNRPGPDPDELPPEQEPETAPIGDPPTDAAPEQEGVWEKIDENTPRDGRDLLVRWHDEDEGRLVRWGAGRHFTGRKWVAGGSWRAADGMMPLPMTPPIEWLRVPGYNDEPAAEPEAA
jgi:hypothetical protein